MSRIQPADLRSDETKAVDAMRDRAVANERERCAQIAYRHASSLTKVGAINACRAIAAEIRRSVMSKTAKTELDELIARLERATGPDRKLFEAAYVACFGEVDWSHGGNWHPFRKFLDFIEVGAWTDAALMLVPDDCVWSLTSGHRIDGPNGHDAFGADCGQYIETSDYPENFGRTPGIALCIAALKARTEQAVRSHRGGGDGSMNM